MLPARLTNSTSTVNIDWESLYNETVTSNNCPCLRYVGEELSWSIKALVHLHRKNVFSNGRRPIRDGIGCGARVRPRRREDVPIEANNCFTDNFIVSIHNFI